MTYLSTELPIVVAAIEAIRSGNVATLQRLLAENPSLAAARLGGATSRNSCEMSRTLLHVATDWPGHYPNGAAIVAALIAAGAEVPPWSARPSRPADAPPDEVTHAFWCACHGGQQQTAAYLLNRGADINWVGYDNLTPLDAARRSGANDLLAWLFHRGAKSTD